MAGLSFTVTIAFDAAKIKGDISKRLSAIQAPLDSLILSDSNYFCPIKTGTLQKSAIINSKIGSGKLRWVTPYARRLYYNYSKPPYQSNPNACGRWVEAAKARWLEKWTRFVNERLKRS